MRQATHTLVIETDGPGLYEVTQEVARWCAGQGIGKGLLTLFIAHTSASLLIQENADPNVQRDLVDHFDRLAPAGGPYRHDVEGPDDMPAHIKSALTHTQISVPVLDAKPALGVWQGIYLFEHRRAPHKRRIVLHLLGE